jgi:hypothetical protein
MAEFSAKYLKTGPLTNFFTEKKVTVKSRFPIVAEKRPENIVNKIMRVKLIFRNFCSNK